MPIISNFYGIISTKKREIKNSSSKIKRKMLPPRIRSVKVLEDYKLLLIYENNENRVYDMKPNLQYEIYKKLKDYSLFKRVHAAGETIEWETGEDISPESLYLNSIKVK